MKKIKKENGYVALFSTIIMGAIFILLFVGMFSLAVGGIKRTADKENMFQAASLANICAEEILSGIKNNIYYGSGYEFFPDENPENFCRVERILRYGDHLRIFTVEGQYGGYKKRIEVEVLIEEGVGIRWLEIVSWKESTDFLE